MSDADKLINLDQCVLDALTLFESTTLPAIPKLDCKRPLVVGSGNAAVTGRMIFEKYDSVFADESTYETVLSNIPAIDGAILISSSGGKHAPTIAQHLKEKDINTVLLTNNKNALARKHVDSCTVFPHQSEPYTYNTSTYLSMITAYTKEDPTAIKDHITAHVADKIPSNLGDFDAFYIIVPEKFDTAREMFMTKFDELFGSIISGRVFTLSQTSHAKTVVPNSKELFISLGVENTMWGEHRLHIPLPDNANYASCIATGYYTIGHIQRQHPSYFKDNIGIYTQKVSELFGQTIKPIVE